MCWLQLQKSLDLTGAIMSRVGHTHSSLGLYANSSSRNLCFMLVWCGLRVLLCQCLVCKFGGWEDFSSLRQPESKIKSMVCCQEV